METRLKHQFYTFISGFIMILDGIFRIISFGGIPSSMDYSFYIWVSKREIKRRRLING